MKLAILSFNLGIAALTSGISVGYPSDVVMVISLVSMRPTENSIGVMIAAVITMREWNLAI